MGKEGRSRVCCEISQGQKLGWSAEQIPFGKQRSVCKGQNDSCGNTVMLAKFIGQTRPTLKATTDFFSQDTVKTVTGKVQAFSDWPSLVTFSCLRPSAQDLRLYVSTLALNCCLALLFIISPLFHLVTPRLPSEILRSSRVKQCIKTNSKIFTECLSILYIQLKGIQRSLRGSQL